MRGLMSSTTDPCCCTAPLSAVQRRELNLMRNFAVSFGLLSMLTGLGGFYYYGFTCECMHLGMGGCMRGGQNCATDCPAPPPRSQLGSAGRPRATLYPLSQASCASIWGSFLPADGGPGVVIWGWVSMAARSACTPHACMLLAPNPTSPAACGGALTSIGPPSLSCHAAGVHR